MLPDIDRVSTIIREVAETEILPRFRHLATADIREKGPGDLVTVADEASEVALTRRLADLLPGSVVIGEEATAADITVLDRIHGDDPVWIIDPIDGTSNFAAGKQHFGVIVALAAGGETLAGWIHDPLGGRMAVAEKGQGAWLDGARLRTAPASELPEMTGVLSSRYFDASTRERLEGRKLRLARTFSLGCAAHEYLKLNAGETHFSIYRRIMPWDHAAGALMHAEAGGYHARIDGTPYSPTQRDGGLLLAPDRASWTALRDLLFGE
ncbi:inositol-1-monophosphatase [Skermanella stibiiresistens SB22]|uniref:Inositol-1-monophosphatase n=1 Tax=Skermanella stibiiresistens SB22 TaxID=1385369 RepID=W9HC38_9PROT|nr:inositol monophosphatase family protein [Skermanella stibiiresistens]EWY42257.1 inositol-1-monophosphatase [Skermanella stibiiresistens SB22]